MITLKTVNQVRTMRQVKSFRSCPTSTGLSTHGADLGRMLQEEVARHNREARRERLLKAWQRRCLCCR
ncbi:hypothetical protein [Desulfobacca acetoxidans]|uniref:Uncharacterized protein n=1 Tax=Desulfobacca acetoxidans (strain ATCC 700848 / DSM 11109 / ASRB2) TaxID=880072 RepID=F2NHZ9_DESAR|nr:hypothetical protein [Desulfobacca acetoxidans]AEB09625.1 hypothetical protein Desac_1785 [Desulfobacca acetoxidans DSM 11109]